MEDGKRLVPHRVQRQRSKGWKMPPNTAYVGRPSAYGNPVEVGQVFEDAVIATKADAARYFRKHATTIMDGVDLEPLRGKNLACWCAIISHGEYVPCHADVLLSIANNIPMEDVIRENTRRSKGEAVR